MSDVEAVAQLSQTRDQIYAEVGKAVIGQKQIVEELLVALLSGGHCLLVGVPGLAKTTLIQTIARTLDLSFGRIQFTPDLMPSDITGTDVLEEDAETGHKTFRFIRGPLFANIILADEINRTPPKTQAALLQAMQEHAVTAGGETMRLDEPFFVLGHKTPLSRKAPTRCPKPNSTALSSSCGSITRARPKKKRSCAPLLAAKKPKSPKSSTRNKSSRCRS